MSFGEQQISQHYTSLQHAIRQACLKAGRSADELHVVAVTKGHPKEVIQQAYRLGIRDFGESRVQEMQEKISSSPADIRWHFIGTLQKNKVNQVVGQVFMIHSVDSFELAQKISMRSAQEGVTTSVLLQVNTSGEATKHGMTEQQLKERIGEIMSLPALRCEGLMTMAPLTEDTETIRRCFSRLRHLRKGLIGDYPTLKQLSMGMTHDYPLAIEEGATILRIGSALFARQ